jgi:SOS-response transcriptional repressor LexA
MSEPTLTARRRGVIEGRMPTVRELGRLMGISSPNGVCGHLRALSKKGLLTFEGRKSRGIRLTEPSPLERAIKLLKAGVGANPEDIDTFLREVGNGEAKEAGQAVDRQGEVHRDSGGLPDGTGRG